MTGEQNARLANEFTQKEIVDRYGMTAQLAMHDLSSPNPHFHVNMPTRDFSEDGKGFGNIRRDWQSRDVVKGWRKSWANHCNVHLEKHGHDARVDHRSLIDQGITDRQPTRHRGPALDAQIKRLTKLNKEIARLEEPSVAVRQQQTQTNGANQGPKMR